MKRRRNSLRLRGWNYASAGYYFVTICTHQREHLFETMVYKEVAEIITRLIPAQKSKAVIELDEWVVMPNHVHLILVIVIGNAEEYRTTDKFTSGSVGQLVSVYKRKITLRINNLRKIQGAAVWQRGYYDRIIRSEKELNATRKYIQNNPQRWTEDRENLDVLLEKMTYHK